MYARTVHVCIFKTVSWFWFITQISWNQLSNY